MICVDVDLCKYIKSYAPEIDTLTLFYFSTFWQDPIESCICMSLIYPDYCMICLHLAHHHWLLASRAIASKSKDIHLPSQSKFPATFSLHSIYFFIPYTRASSNFFIIFVSVYTNLIFFAPFLYTHHLHSKNYISFIIDSCFSWYISTLLWPYTILDMIKSVKPFGSTISPAQMVPLPVHEVNTQTAFTPSSSIVDKYSGSGTMFKPPGATARTLQSLDTDEILFPGCGVREIPEIPATPSSHPWHQNQPTIWLWNSQLERGRKIPRCLDVMVTAGKREELYKADRRGSILWLSLLPLTKTR